MNRAIILRVPSRTADPVVLGGETSVSLSGQIFSDPVGIHLRTSGRHSNTLSIHDFDVAVGGKCESRLIGFSTSLNGGQALRSVIEDEQSGETRLRVEFYRAIEQQVCSGQKPAPDLVFGQIVTRDMAIVRQMHEEVGAVSTVNEMELPRQIEGICIRIGLAFRPHTA